MHNSTHSSTHGGARPKVQKKKYLQNDVNAYSDSSTINQDQIDDNPLEKREVTIYVNGIQMRKKALDPHWIERKVFMECTHPYFLADDSLSATGGIETWMEEILFLCSDMEWLLSLPHYKFWSQIIHDSSVHNCLDTFLTVRLRWFDNLAYNDEMRLATEKIDQLVFLVYLRMSTHKESKTEYISPKAFGDLIYNNYIFDCCKFLDLCVLYGNSNTKLLNKMMHNVFSNQPKYSDDLGIMISSLKNVLSNTEKELSIFPDKIPIPLKKLTDVINFMADNIFSVSSFVNVYPEASMLFHKENYVERLCIFYQAVVPFISENLCCLSQDGVNVDELNNTFIMARIGVLSLFRDILHNICIRPLRSNNLSMEKLEECTTLFIHITTTAAEERIFITDFDSMYGFNEDLKLFQEVGVDITALDYIKESISKSVSETLSMYGSKMEFSEQRTFQPAHNHFGDDTSGMNVYFDASQEDGYEIESPSLIDQVRELLPDIGTDFVNECLKYYSYSVEDTINAILECNLPPSLSCLDRTKSAELLPGIKSSNLDQNQINEGAGKSIIEDRGNVYNGDEFDTFSSKDTLKKVFTGKKPLVLKEPDEQFMKTLKAIGRQYEENAGYSIYEDEMKYTPMHEMDYEDEYDDTYDGTYKASFGKCNAAESGSSIFGKGALNIKGINFDATPSGSEPECDATSSQASSQRNKRTNIKSTSNNSKSMKSNNFRKGDNSRKGQQKMAVEEVTEPNTNTSADTNNQEYKRQPKVVDFCENPEDIRKRKEESRRSKFVNSRRHHPIGQQQYHMPTNPVTMQPEGKAKSASKNSDKTSNPEKETGASKEGKQKQPGDNKANANAYRKKTIHKNEHKRFGAQAKQRGRF